MDSLRRFYFSLAESISVLTRSKVIADKIQDDTVATRVSREVLYYKTHFFNL